LTSADYARKIILESFLLFVVNLLHCGFRGERGMGKSFWIPILIILLPYGLSHASDTQSPTQEYRTANKLFAASQYWIAFCCLLMGNDAEAVTEFLKIPALYPSSGMWVGTAYYWAGRASERRGNTEDAAEYYRKAGGNGRSTQGRFALKKATAVQEK
jgi:tetratricopeptide (TPR) repeat protein